MAVMVGLIAVGLVLTQVLGRGHQKISADRALAIARPKVAFEPAGHTIRFLRRGIPPRGYWLVSYWTRKQDGSYDKITVVILDATTGRITEVRRSA